MLGMAPTVVAYDGSVVRKAVTGVARRPRRPLRWP